MAVRKKRKRGMERLDVGKFARKYGYDFSHISRIVRGGKRPGIRLLMALARELKKDPGRVAAMLGVADSRKPRFKIPKPISAKEYYEKTGNTIQPQLEPQTGLPDFHDHS